jgi:5-formyltetrahydrofolate cyclo-ligase
MTGDPRIPRGPDALPDADAGDIIHQQAAKAALRKALRAARGALDPAIKVQWDAQIGARVVAWWRLRQVDAIGVYWPLAGEPDLRAAYAELHAAGARLALPVVMERDAPLAFTAWTPGEPTIPDEMGVQVPAELRFVARPPALLVPCLGFNAAGYRLGYGGGYYDRTLAELPRAVAVGFGWSDRLVRGGLPVEPFDIPLAAVVTERGLVLPEGAADADPFPWRRGGAQRP